LRAHADGCGCFPTGQHYPGIAHLLRVRVAGLVPELDGEAPWADLPIALIDTETTGRDAQNDRIVEIGIVIGRRGDVLAKHGWLVNPGRPIPDEAKAVHGISDEMVANEPRFEELVPEIARVLAGTVPAAYNAPFDKGFVLAELDRAGADESARPASLDRGVEWLDPLVWVRELQKYEKGKSLGDVTARMGIVLETAHRATDDAHAALRVLYALGRDVRVPKSYAALVQEQRRLGRQQDEERARWRSNRGG
jgi:DNA polymerase-3 subunit epsilon